MSNPMLIGFPSLRSNFTYSGGNWEGDYPVTNAANSTYARVARSQDALAESTTITLSSADAHPVRLLGFFAHNMELQDTFRVSCYDDLVEPEQLLYQSDIEYVWEIVYSTTDRLFETENWFTGQYTEQERIGQIASRPFILPEGISPNKIVIEFFTQNPVDIGLLEVAGAIELQSFERPVWGATWGYESQSIISRSMGGLLQAEIYAPSYVFQGEIPYMGNDKARHAMSELYRQYGEHTPFMWVPFPDDPLTYLRESKMVVNKQSSLLSFATNRHMSVPLNLIEWMG